jgi:hypothetical protein
MLIQKILWIFLWNVFTFIVFMPYGKLNIDFEELKTNMFEINWSIWYLNLRL